MALVVAVVARRVEEELRRREALVLLGLILFHSYIDLSIYIREKIKDRRKEEENMKRNEEGWEVRLRVEYD